MMSHSDSQYTKLRWILTVAGLVIYVVDIGTDIGLTQTYFEDGHYLWAGLTLAFVLIGLLVSQIFSCAWYWDDMNAFLINPEGKPTIAGLSKCGLCALHLLGMGVFIRYCQLLKKGFCVIWTSSSYYTVDEIREKHHNLFCLATDLSMLKLFEAFFESAPQLLLQVYIVLLRHGEASLLQYLSMVFSFFSIAWSLVDYRRCLRRSLPHVSEMPSGLPTVVYLLYKLCTITSLILSYSIFLILSLYSTVALAVVWLVAMTWTHILQTNFCSTRRLELLYRAVVGVILMFTFFNVKGQDTKVVMSVYYFIVCVINITSLVLLFIPEFKNTLLAVCILICGCLLLGLFFLVLYYVLLHPTGSLQEADEVDGLSNENNSMKRIRAFLQP